jgi:hypothetical protein
MGTEHIPTFLLIQNYIIATNVYWFAYLNSIFCHIILHAQFNEKKAVINN